MIFASMFKYQFDRTGQSLANKVLDEEKVIAAGKHVPFVLREGAFFTKGLTIMRDGSTAALVAGTDFTYVSIDPYLTALTGQEVATSIQMVDPAFTGTLRVTYQAVGGPEGLATSLIVDLINALKNTQNAPAILWDQIKNRPSQFPTGIHRHAASALDELEKISQSFDDMTNALVNRVPMGESGQDFQEQIDRLLRVVAQLRTAVSSIAVMRGSADQIKLLEEKMNRFEMLADADYTVIAGASRELGRWPLAEVRGVCGGVLFKAASGVHHIYLSVVAHGTTVKVSGFGDNFTDTKLFTISAVVDNGELVVVGTPTSNGAFRVKWLYAL